MTNDERKRIVEFEQGNRNVLYSFGCLNPEEGHKILLEALALTDQKIRAKLFVAEGYYSFEDIKSFAKGLGISKRVDIESVKLFDVTSLLSHSILSVVVSSLSASSAFPVGLDSWNTPLLVSATEKNRQLVIDGVTGLMHSPGNCKQLGKQINYIYRNPAVSEYLARAHDFYYSKSSKSSKFSKNG